MSDEFLGRIPKIRKSQNGVPLALFLRKGRLLKRVKGARPINILLKRDDPATAKFLTFLGGRATYTRWAKEHGEPEPPQQLTSEQVAEVLAGKEPSMVIKAKDIIDPPAKKRATKKADAKPEAPAKKTVRKKAAPAKKSTVKTTSKKAAGRKKRGS